MSKKCKSWITVPSFDTEPLKSLAEPYCESDGSLDHILAVHGLHPGGLTTHAAMYKELMFGKGPLSRLERELIAVAVSGANACRY